MAEQTLDNIFFNKKIDNVFLVNSIKKHINKLAVDIGSRPITNEQSIKKTENYITSYFKNIGLQVHQQQYKYGNKESILTNEGPIYIVIEKYCPKSK